MGILYHLSDLNCSAVRIVGQGTIPFLDAKFTSSFSLPGRSRSCWLTPKGRVRDVPEVVVVSPEEA